MCTVCHTPCAVALGYAIFAPSPAVCLANGIDIELERLELTKDQMDPAEYDEAAWDKMEITVAKLNKMSTHTDSGNIKMSDIQDGDGVYLFADGLWAYKMRLVDADGNTGPYSLPSAVINIAKEEEKKEEGAYDVD